MIAVWIIARLPIIREGLRVLLSASDLQVRTVAPAEWESLADSLLDVPPDVILLDVDVLDLEGWPLLRELASSLPRTSIVLLTQEADDRRLERALLLGARGMLPRDAARQDLDATVRAAA